LWTSKAGGRFFEALAIGGELIRTSPDNEEYAQAVLQVLHRRLEMLDGDYVVLSERPLRQPRQLRPQPTILAGLQTQLRVIYALMMRETRTRLADSKLGYGWALLEPVLRRQVEKVKPAFTTRSYAFENGPSRLLLVTRLIGLCCLRSCRNLVLPG
jgi:hypothetical protein